MRTKIATLILGAFVLWAMSARAASLGPEELRGRAQTAKLAVKPDRLEFEKEDLKAVRRFQEKLADYATLHFLVARKVDAELHRDQPYSFAAAMIAQRAKAEPGDVFVKDVQPLLRRLIVSEFRGAGAVSTREAMVEDEGPNPEVFLEVVVRVNARFPSGAVRSTMPIGVLRVLPPLPDCLRYGLVKGDLVLVDTVSQTIVDYMKAVIPAAL